jgi:YD repeat-containing protein
VARDQKITRQGEQVNFIVPHDDFPSGEEVIVDWLRADTSEAGVAHSGRSVTVQQSETDGSVTLRADETIGVDAGLYSGPLGGATGALTLSLAGTGQAGGSKAVDGSTAGYFTEYRYNALNVGIATNAETGLWREFGVDAGGNVLETRNFGLDRTGEPITTYAAFDGRNREVAHWGQAAAVHGETEKQRQVTRLAYDFNDQIVSESDAGNQELKRTWSALGKQTSETDRLGNTKTYHYDRRGNLVAETDALGNTQYKFYDAAGNLVRQIDGAGHATDFAYDVFGRRTRIVNGLNQSIEMSYDQRDRLVEVIDGLGYTTRYAYDGRNNRTETVDANGHVSRQVYDGLGRVIDTITSQNGQELHQRSQYDAYGNMVATTDEMGRITTKVYGAFGRLEEEIDPAGRITSYDYDDQGRAIREWGSSGKDIRRSYDDAGRLLTVNDVATGVKTVYSYDIDGNRMSETLTGNGAHNRSILYEYDALGQMTRWADSVTGMHTNYAWDAAGNLHRAYTDLGYDPDGKGLGGSTRMVDHLYAYDGNNRVTQISQNGAVETQYGYDEAGNRNSYYSQGTMTEYDFDADGWVTHARVGGKVTAEWQYDKVGNVMLFRNFKEFGGDGTLGEVVGDVASWINTVKETSYQYYENNRNWYTNSDGQQTILTLDKSGRTLRTTTVDGGTTYIYDHHYNSAGLETGISARGDDISGSTYKSYDVNDHLTTANAGQGDNQDRAEIRQFVYNNDGQILYRFHDSGEGSDITHTEYAYADGYAVGQTGNTKDAAHETLLDTGKYNLVQPLGCD